jgi:hypothetical protein
MTRIAIAVLGFHFVVGCTAGEGGGDASARGYVEAVATADGLVDATYVAGRPPSSGGGIAVGAVADAAVIPGGSTRVVLDADAAFSTAIIAIDGIDGYYRIELPGASATVELVVVLSQELSARSFDWMFGVGTGGSVGPYTTSPVTVVPVGTGDVQVSLSWNSSADVDLHVIDPGGEEVYYGNRLAASGGELDLDSNAACGSDGPRNENITWPVRGAPAGAYDVLVDYWSSCDEPVTDFTVTINVAGAEPLTFSGTFTGEGDFGGAGDGERIAGFVAGPRATSPEYSTRHLGTFDVHLAPGATAHDK